MSDQILNVGWHHVHPVKDGVGQIGFINKDTGEVYSRDESEFHGLYLMKDEEDQHYFAWSKSKVLWWEKITLNDLLDLGVQGDDVKQIIPYCVYRLPLMGKAVSTGDSFL